MSMDMVVKVILAILETFIFFGFGAWAYYLKMIEDKDLGKLGRLSIDMLLPFLTFSSVVKNFTAKDIGMIWQLPLIGLGIMAFGALCGYLLVYGLHDKSPRRNGTFIHLAIANNYIFLPLVVLGNLFGTKAVAALMLLSVGSTIGFWTFGVGVLAGRDFKRVFRNVCS
ncbi:MAG: AEC family transporter, partial [Lentisphaeria bacterium]|nr:AEC family transporter [Lentisphaeria bacterium]